MWQQGFPLPSRRQWREACLESEWSFLEESAVVVVVAAEVLSFAAAGVVPSASGGGLSALCSGSGDAPHEPTCTSTIRIF